MYKNESRIKNAFAILLFCISIAACNSKNTSGSLEREDLFTIRYGIFEDQLHLFQLDSTYTRPDTQISMNDGIFYISNSYSGKILQMTSFGDLLSLYYNPEKNPAPAFMGADQNKKITTRRTIVYPLNTPSYLTVTGGRHLFAVDTVPDDRIEYDYSENIALRHIIIHFNESGEFIDTIGQEGVGGTPFPFVEGIYTNANEELIAVNRTDKQLCVYWYDNQGSLRYKIPFSFKEVPSPYQGTDVIFSSIDKIVPDFNEKKLYIKADHYREDIDSATNVSAGISYDKSSLHIFNIEKKEYEQTIEIAPYEGSEKTSTGQVHFKKVYNLLGVTAQNRCFFTTPQPNGYMLKIIDLQSNKIYTRHLDVSDEELVYNTFNLSPDGILSALLARNTEAAIVWWRTNELTGAATDER